MTDRVADRVRRAIGERPGIAEIRMMGGLCFTLNGNMLVATTREQMLLVRVGERQVDEALTLGAQPMRMGERVMKGFVAVAPSALDEKALKGWVGRALAFVEPLPAKVKADKPIGNPKSPAG